MRLKYCILLILYLITLNAYCQIPYAIKGSIKDTSSNVPLSNASICILNAKDSILIKFTWTDKNGDFSIDNLRYGNFILLVTYPQYADYVERFRLDSTHLIYNFQSIYLQLKARLLQEVIVKGNLAGIKIIADTTEYNAKAYIIQPNSKVEDLLRQLPGIEVDKDGKITANGQAVNKILVDGEEFFSDDPTLVTRNIRADMVDKVQLYEKKSDQATFTGIDNGLHIKTINVKLKEDKNTGTFGKVDGGVGSNQGYFQAQAIYNKFSQKTKYSAYLTLANTGKAGLDQSLESSLGADDNMQIGEDGLIFITGSPDELNTYDGRYSGIGIPLAKTGGLHYDDKWNNNNESLNFNYRIGSIDIKGETVSLVQQNSNNGIIQTSNSQSFENYAFRQRLDATYKIKLDSSVDFKIGIIAILRNFRTVNTYNGSGKNGNAELLNINGRDINSSGNEQVINTATLLTKKFKKARTTFSWNIAESYTNTLAKNYLNSIINYYDSLGQIDSIQTTNQFKNGNVKRVLINSNMVFSEPISVSSMILISYSFGLYNNLANQRSFDKSVTGTYDVPDYDFTSDYTFNQLANQLGILYNLKTKKSTLNLGTRVSHVAFQQNDQLFDAKQLKRDFTFWSPQINYQYSLSRQKSFSFRYDANAIQPTIEQIQPLKTNIDPLNIISGNPNLKPSFTQRFNLNYRSNNPLKNQSFFLNGDFSMISDQVASSTVVDENSGSSVMQYVNVTGKMGYNYYLGININRKVKPVNVSMNGYIYTNSNVYYTYINNVLNKAQNQTFGGTVSVQKNETKKYSLFISAGPNYYINQFSVERQYNNNAPGYQISGSSMLFILKKIQLASEISHIYKGKTSVFAAQQRTIWNASVSKTFFNEDNLKCSISANDLLNQNQIYSRSVIGNMISQSSSTGIKRYLMLSVTWDFTRFKTIPVN